MAWTYETTRKGYTNLWLKAKLRPERKATVLARARKIVTNKTRYQQLETRTGVPWWWIAVAHNLEGAGNFNTYLGNGQSIAQRTTIKPIGRGPFKSFEEGAIDAIKLKGFDKIKVWDISRALFHWEEFNGFGYVSKGINSPYVWSFTNLYSRGKYVRDHVYSATAVSEQVGAAAMLMGLIELGEVNLTKDEETLMAELHASLVPFERLAPVLITTLAGPAARLAISVLADAIEELTGEDTPAKLDTVRDRIDALPGKLIAPVLQKAEAAIEEVLPAAPVEPQVRAEEPIVASPTITAPTTQSAPVSVPESGTVTVQPVQPAPSGIDRFIPAGWKTAIGIAVYVVASVGMTLGYLPADVATALMTVGGGLAGYGVIAKIERWLPVFAGFMKIRKA